MMIAKHHVIDDVRRALMEDIGSGDVTAALLPENLLAHAEILSREKMVVCGQPWVEEVFREVDPKIKINWHVAEGEGLQKPAILCEIIGPVRSILTGERCALNFLQTLSATATKTKQYVQRINNYPTQLLDTRKTLPGLRMAQKYAVACAGAANHRFGLYDAFLIKENHIAACGSIRKAIALAREVRGNLLVEIEVETLHELEEALMAKPDRILLDNFTIEMLKEAVKRNQPKQCDLEASGGIDLDTIAEVASTGIDFISIGSITKSIQAIDLSLLIK